MKFILTLLFGFLTVFQNSGIDALRNSYQNVNASPEKANEFISAAKNAGASDAITLGYKAAADFLAAKYEKEPHRRRLLLTKGVRELETQILKNSNNAELRLIRFSVQENLPKIVGYFRNLHEDKAFLIKNYSKQTPAVKALIQHYAQQSRTMTPEEKNMFK